MHSIPLMKFRKGGGKSVCTGIYLRNDNYGADRNHPDNYRSSDLFREKGQGPMRRSNRGIGEGVAFTALIISASAMDSDSRVLPAVICLGAVSALFWMGQAHRQKESPDAGQGSSGLRITHKQIITERRERIKWKGSRSTSLR